MPHRGWRSPRSRFAAIALILPVLAPSGAALAHVASNLNRIDDLAGSPCPNAARTAPRSRPAST